MFCTRTVSVVCRLAWKTSKCLGLDTFAFSRRTLLFPSVYFVEFERLTCRTKELIGLLLLRIWNAVCVYGMCVVQITKTLIILVIFDFLAKII